jgi:hypothetical protein
MLRVRVLMSSWEPSAGCVQDRDGGRLLDRLRFAMPGVALVWADGGYARRLVDWARRVLRIGL